MRAAAARWADGREGRTFVSAGAAARSGQGAKISIR